jgi:membrane protease YdiL (CAAX protease family)
MDKLTADRATIVIFNSVCEGGLLLMATIWCFNKGVNLSDALEPNAMAILVGVGAAVLTTLTGFLLYNRAGKADKKSAFYNFRLLVSEITPIFSRLTLMDILLIAASTGFCEEVFFRGVLQPEIGVLAASLVFGMIHCGSMEMFPYALWTYAAGVFLGYLYIWTGSLWAPILAHGINNFIVITYFKYRKQ